MKYQKILKYTSLAVILALSIWMLKPPAYENQEEENTGAPTLTLTGAEKTKVKYTIRFSPGYSYMPGMTPAGIGKRLEGLAEVIKDYEKLFPDTHIELVTAPVVVREYLVTQLSSGMAPEIINVNVEDVWQDVQKGWYIALDPFLEAPNPFVKPGEPGSRQWWDMFKYQAISRGKAAPDKKNYCLSYDMIETGIFYNKDIFRKVGVDVPKDFEEFMANCQKIKDAGYIPILMTLGSMVDWGVDLFFDQLYKPLLPGIDLVKDPTREQYLRGYLDWDEICFLRRKGFFSENDPRWVEIWKIMHRFRQMANRNLTTVDPVREFVTQTGSMFWAPSDFTYRLLADKQLGFDWGVFYLPPLTKATTKYADGHPMCVIGGSGTQYEITNSAIKDTGDPATSKQLKRCIQFLQFLTAPENYVKIVNETPRFLPNIVDVPVLPTLEPFARILEREYTTTKWTYTFDLKFSEILQRMLILHLNDGITLEKYLWWLNTSLQQACQNIEERKPPDWQELQRHWDESASIRKNMKDLPDEAYR